MSSNQIEQLQADADYYHDRVALRELEFAQKRLREERLNMMTREECSWSASNALL